MRTFVFKDDTSNKFWNIDHHGASFTVTFGKVGTKGQTQTKEFPDADKARAAHDKLVAEKLGKGYVETTAGAAEPGPWPLARSLEEAIVQNPADAAAHAAYADYLAEQGDPRGELIQVQLALEDPGRPATERTRLRVREAELLKAHARAWLGDVGRFLVGEWSGEDKPYHYEIVRGWLDRVRMLPFPDTVIAALARTPEARLLRRLEIIYDMRYHPFEFEDVMPTAALRDGEEPGETYEAANIMPPLLASPHFTNLRVFKLGFSDTGDRLAHSTMVQPFGNCTPQQVIRLLDKCPRLEELYLNDTLYGIDPLFAHTGLGNLRVLQYYYASSYAAGTQDEAYPLSVLAANRSLGKLTTLRLHPGRDATININELDPLLRSPNLPSLTHLQVHMTAFGDEGCRRIVESGILKRLKTLDLAYGGMTDAGARLLASSPDVRHLVVLDVSRNALTGAGIAALRATGVRVAADDQHGADDEDYLFEVDLE
jgi:uncharacterized protein (TIGR02996 family)